MKHRIMLIMVIGILALCINLVCCAQVKDYLKNPEQLYELYCGELWQSCDTITDDNRLPCLIQTSICASVTPSQPLTRDDTSLLRDMERRLGNERD